MATVTLIVPGVLPHLRPDPVQPRFVLASSGGLRCELPLAPLPSTHGGFGPSWEVLGRSGRTGFLVPVDVQPKSWSATLTVCYPSDREKSIDPLLKKLEALRASKDRVSVTYGRPERGVWRIIDMTYDVTARQPGTNEATAASVQLSLQQAVDVPTVIGPKRAPATATKKNPPVAPKKPAHPTHVVKHGETLQTISLAEYGDALHWRQIGDANKLTNATLKVGQRLKLPT
jgi:LysM repeat protein